MRRQQLLGMTRKAADDYSMIQDGDKIAVGISGGKDSLTLLTALHGLQRFYPAHFTLHAITVDLGFDGFDLSSIQDYCDSLDVPYSIIKTNIGNVVFDIRHEQNPCSLCAKLRKGALNAEAKRQNCNKVAYAHHKDDIVETMMLSMLYEGRFYAFPPVTYLERTQLTVIRPLMYANEQDIAGFARDEQLPVCSNPCPADGHTRREYVKQLLRRLDQENPGARDRMFHAIINGNIEDWPERNNTEEEYRNRKHYKGMHHKQTQTDQ